MGKKYPWDGPGGQGVFGRLVLQFVFFRDLEGTLEFDGFGACSGVKLGLFCCLTGWDLVVL